MGDNKLKTLYKDSETGCCPKFDPTPWDKKEVKFKDKLFLKDKVVSFFHIPLNMGRVITRDMEKIVKTKALTEKPLMLSDEKSVFGSDIYIEVTKSIKGANCVKMSGTFLTKVYTGPYRDMGRWVKDMHEFVSSKKKTIKKMYFFYTMCPKCAKHYGQNYTVILAEI